MVVVVVVVGVVVGVRACDYHIIIISYERDKIGDRGEGGRELKGGKQWMGKGTLILTNYFDDI